MKKSKPKNKSNVFSRARSSKASKAISKIIKKISRIGKKRPTRSKLAKKTSTNKLVLKENFVKLGAEAQKEVLSAQPSEQQLPSHYSENKLTLLVRDPWWLYSYWEVTPWREAEVAAEIERLGLGREKTVLRVYDITEASPEKTKVFFDIEINHLNSNWYIDVGSPDREWIAEIGYKTQNGRFFALVRSNAVKTPPFGISDVLDEEWMMPDEMYFKLLGIIGGFESAGGSLQVRKMVEKYIRQSASSETVAQLSKAKPVS